MDEKQRARLVKRLAQTRQSELVAGRESSEQLRVAINAGDSRRVADLIADESSLKLWIALVVGQECEDAKALSFSLADGAVNGIEAFVDGEELLAALPQARPQPLPALEVVRRALVFGGSLRLNAKRQMVLPAVAASALAAGDHWLPPWDDQQLRQRISEICSAENLALIGLTPGSSGETIVEIAAAPTQKQQVMKVVAALNQEAMVAARCGRIALQLTQPQWA